jgi:hypothetical protein
MKEERGWIIKDAPCESCGGTHDLFFDAEPVLHRDIIFTCPITETGSRLRIGEAPQPVEEHSPDSVKAHIL